MRIDQNNENNSIERKFPLQIITILHVRKEDGIKYDYDNLSFD